MTPPTVDKTMVFIALATPVLAVLIYFVCGRAAAQGGEDLSPRLRRNAVLLALAGPANLGFWWFFNRWLDGVGYRSVIGYVGAAVVFVAAGFATGWFGRLRGTGRSKRRARGETEGVQKREGEEKKRESGSGDSPD